MSIFKKFKNGLQGARPLKRFSERDTITDETGRPAAGDQAALAGATKRGGDIRWQLSGRGLARVRRRRAQNATDIPHV
jgi:hypothetical protein